MSPLNLIGTTPFLELEMFKSTYSSHPNPLSIAELRWLSIVVEE
jgi:hypothetical protein